MKNRNNFHYIVGFTFGYLIGIVTGMNKFPISLEYWNNLFTPILIGLLVSMCAFWWERWQERKLGGTFDKKDILRSGLGGVAGGFFSFIFVSWYIAIPLFILSTYLLIFKYKK